MQEACGVTVAIAERPWEIEASIIQRLAPPLNISHAVHRFAEHAKLRRLELRRACGV